MHFPDALDEQIRGALFQDDALRAQLHGLDEFVLILGGRQHDDPGLMLAVLDFLQRGQTVQAGHLEIQQQDIGLEALEHVQDLSAILRLRYHFEIRLQRQQPAQAVAEDGVVVRDHDPDLGALRLFRSCGKFL
jgi:hypothetical protein